MFLRRAAVLQSPPRKCLGFLFRSDASGPLLRPRIYRTTFARPLSSTAVPPPPPPPPSPPSGDAQQLPAQIQSFVQQRRPNDAWNALQELMDTSRPGTATSTEAPPPLSIPQLLDMIPFFWRTMSHGNEFRHRVDIVSRWIRNHPDFIRAEDYPRLIRTVARAGYRSLAQELLEEARGSGVLVPSFAYAALIHAHLVEHRKEEAIALYQQMRQDGVDPDPALYSALMHGFCLIGDGKNAMLFGRLKEKAGFGWSPEDVESLTRAQFLNPDINEQQLEAWLQSVGPSDRPVSPSVCRAILWGYLERGDVPRTERWYKRSMELFPDVSYLHLPMLTAYIQTGDLEKATAFYRQIRTRFLPDGFYELKEGGETMAAAPVPGSLSASEALKFFSSMMQGHVLQNDLSSAFSVFQEMQRCGLQPNQYHYSILMNGYVRIRDVKSAQLMLSLMEKSQLPVDVVAHGTLLNSYTRSRRLESAFELYEEIKRCGLPVNEYVATMILNGSAWAQDLRRFAEVYQDILEYQVKPSVHLYCALIYTHGLNGELEKSEQMFSRLLSEFDREVNVYAFNCMMSAYVHCNEPQEAYKLLKDMRERQIQPSLGTYTIMMELASLEGEWERVLRFFQVLIRDPNVPNIPSHCIATLFKILGSNEQTELMKGMFERLQTMEEKEVHIGPRVWTIYIHYLVEKAAEPEEALKAVQTALDKNVDFSSQMMDSVLRAFQDHASPELWQEVSQLVERYYAEYRPSPAFEETIANLPTDLRKIFPVHSRRDEEDGGDENTWSGNNNDKDRRFP